MEGAYTAFFLEYIMYFCGLSKDGGTLEVCKRKIRSFT